MRAALGRPAARAAFDAMEVVENLARDVEPGLLATGSGRFYGFVIGGAMPATIAADWLASAWDQNAARRFRCPRQASSRRSPARG